MHAFSEDLGVLFGDLQSRLLRGTPVLRCIYINYAAVIDRITIISYLEKLTNKNSAKILVDINY